MARIITRWKVRKWGTRFLTNVGKHLPDPHSRAIVLCYHSINPEASIRCASPELFDEHMQWLAEACECVPFSQIMDRAADKSRTKPVVSVTFDDGYLDNYEIALPLLAKSGVPATFFLTAGLLEKEPAVVKRFEYLLRVPYEQFVPMSWEQAGEMRDAGMEIGAHTYRHPNLALLSTDEVREELSHSRDFIEDRLGSEVTTMAYPFGKPRRHVTREVAKIAGDVGFRHAGSIIHRGVRRRDDAFAIPRFTVLRDSIETLSAKVRGAFDVVGFGQDHGPLWTAKLVSPDDFRFGTETS